MLEKIKYKYNDNVIYKKMPNMIMAYNQDNGDMYEFNEVGAEILLYVSENIQISDIFDKLCKDYSVTKEEIYEDVKEIFDRMFSLKIIYQTNKITINKVYDIETEKLLKYVETIKSEDNNFDGCSNFKDLNKENYDEWIEKTKMGEKQENLPAEYVPSFSYVASIDDEIIGSFNIRPTMTEKVEKYSGNIGYLINPLYRNKGFGTKVLELCLEECKNYDLKQVIITCKEENIGSKRVIENNNGIFIEKIHNPEKSCNSLRYKIEL